MGLENKLFMRTHHWIFILILSISLVSHSETVSVVGQTQQLRQQEAELKKQLEQFPLLQQNVVRDLALNLAFEYLEIGSVQEAIWVLDRGGFQVEAQSMSSQLENYLKTAPIMAIKNIGQGVTGSSIVILENGMKAILKPKDLPSSLAAEIWAYEFDRRSGFNMIPTTVQRRIQGVDYSVHIFIEKAIDSEIKMLGQDYLDHADLYVLDYILGTHDRHGGNSMLSQAGRLFAIDHGRIGMSVLSDEFELRYAKNLKVILKLILLESDPKFVRFVRQFAPTLDMTFALKRIRSMKQALGKDFIAHLKSQQDHIVSRSKDTTSRLQLISKFDALFSSLRKPTPFPDGFVPLEGVRFSALANTKDEIWDALKNQNYEKFEKIFAATRIHESFQRKFALSLAEVTKQDSLVVEENIQYLTTFLKRNISTFELMAQQSDSAFLYLLASKDEYFGKSLLLGIQFFQDPNMIRKLFLKYLTDSINLSLSNRVISDAEWILLVDHLRQEDLLDLLRLIEPRIVQRASTYHLLQQIYLENPLRYKSLHQQVILKSMYLQKGSIKSLSIQCKKLFSR